MYIEYKEYIFNVQNVTHIWKSDEQNAVILYFTTGHQHRIDFDDVIDYKGFITKVKNRM